jgi:serine/threonine protein kinase
MLKFPTKKLQELYSIGPEIYSRPDRSVQVHSGSSLIIAKQKVALKYIAVTSYDGFQENHLWEKLPPHHNLPVYFESFEVTNSANGLPLDIILAFESLHHYAPLSQLISLKMNFSNMPKLHKKIVFYQLLLAVKHLHSNDIAHMNITLDNVMVHPKNLNTKLVGLSRSIPVQIMPTLKSSDDFSSLGTSESQSNAEDLQIDTPSKIDHYTSPESISDQNYPKKFSCSTNPETDIWNCGIILFSLLTGKFSFDSQNPENLRNLIKTGAYEIPPKNIFNSPSTVDTADSELLSLFLTIEHSQRPTLKSALQHRFFDEIHTKFSDGNSLFKSFKLANKIFADGFGFKKSPNDDTKVTDSLLNAKNPKKMTPMKLLNGVFDSYWGNQVFGVFRLVKYQSLWGKMIRVRDKISELIDMAGNVKVCLPQIVIRSIEYERERFMEKVCKGKWDELCLKGNESVECGAACRRATRSVVKKLFAKKKAAGPVKSDESFMKFSDSQMGL